jgi:haloalkane dehalogenase
MPLRIALCRTPLLGPLLLGPMNAFAGLLPRFGVASPRELSAAARAGYAYPYRTTRERVAIRRFVEDIPNAPAHPTWREFEEASRAIDAFQKRPAAIVWGERDWCFTPRFREEWQRRLPKAAVHRLRDVGHLVPEEAPEPVEAALRALLDEPTHR